MVGYCGFGLYVAWQQFALADFTAAAAWFVPLGLRGGGAPAAAPGGAVAAFGLLRDGCPVGGAWAGPPANGTAAAYFASPERANGYYFVTAGGDAAADPVNWVVAAAPLPPVNGSAVWSLVGASGWWGVWNTPYPQHAYPTPTARGAVVAVDRRCARPAWPTRARGNFCCRMQYRI